MEWEKIIIAVPGTLAFLWTVYTFLRTRRDAKAEQTGASRVAFETLHLTDAREFRQELRTELKETNERLDVAERELSSARAEIFGLRQEISRMGIEKETLYRKNVEAQAENHRKDQTIQGLECRVLELEKEVHELSTRLSGVEQHQKGE